MPRSNNLSAAARVHVVKAESSDHIDARERGKAKTQTKGKGKGKGKGKARGNTVRDGSPAPVLAGSRHKADYWDDLRRAWAVELLQSKKGGQRANHDHPPHQQHHQPDGQRSESGSAQGRRGRGGGHVHAGQKRTATTNGTTDDGGHATKRHKGDARVPGPGSGAAQRHPDFWHPDGSVVIEVGDTKFRLHQSTLQKHSAYFAATFREKGGRQRGGRTYLEVEVDERSPNGHIPVYRVAETTADDFASLLTVIEEPMKYVDETPPMPVLAGVLRAARALSFDAQCKWAERIFQRMWPSTLDSITAEAIPHAAVALALARTCGLRGVQKRASYELLRMPTFGQTIATAAEVKEGTSRGAHADVALGERSRADLLRLLHAREQLGLAWAEVAGKAPTDFPCPRGAQHAESAGGGSSSATASGCASANVDRMHARWAELVHSTGLYVQRMVDPLMGLQDLMEISWKDEGFCKKCVAARRQEWDRLRKKLWDDLDVWLEFADEVE